MKSIFSTQNRQTFFFRKNCRLPRRAPPGPPPDFPPPSREPCGRGVGADVSLIFFLFLLYAIRVCKISDVSSSQLRLVLSGQDSEPLAQRLQSCADAAATAVRD